MSKRVEVELDDQGRLVVSHQVQEQLGLFSGATLIVEDETSEVAVLRIHPAQPKLIEKDGVLVVQAQPLQDIEDYVQSEHEQRIAKYLREAQL